MTPMYPALQAHTPAVQGKFQSVKIVFMATTELPGRQHLFNTSKKA
jgi:hypothetical protein